MRANSQIRSWSGELLRSLPIGFPIQQIAAIDPSTVASSRSSLAAPAFATYAKSLLHHCEFTIRV